MNSNKIISLIIIILGVLLVVGSGTYSEIRYDGMMGTMKIIDTNCYDKYSNEIKGLTCEDEVIDKYDIPLMIFTVLSAVLIVLGFVSLMFASGRNDDE